MRLKHSGFGRQMISCEFIRWTNSRYISIILLLYINSSDSAPLSFENGKFLQRINLLTGERYVKDLTHIMEPDAVPRLRLLIGTAKVMSSDSLVDVIRVRLRWLEPDSWNDNWQNISQRSFDIICEIEDEETKETHRLIDMRVDSSLSGYDENFLVRTDRPLTLQCRARAVNSLNLASAWQFSPIAKLERLNRRKLRKSATRKLQTRLRTSFFQFA